MEKLGEVIERLELELVDDPRWQEPSDTSYLRPEERANPDIAANVEAMTRTNELIAWFGRDAEGFVGLWRGEQNRPLEAAPVVRLDTEGQYAIVAATVPDYLAISVPEDEFAEVRESLARAGFQVGFNPDAIWGALDAFDDDPNAYRNALYEEGRKARGIGDEAEAAEEDEEEDEGADEGITLQPPAPDGGTTDYGLRTTARTETQKVKPVKAAKPKAKAVKAKAKPTKVKAKAKAKAKAKPVKAKAKAKAAKPAKAKAKAKAGKAKAGKAKRR